MKCFVMYMYDLITFNIVGGILIEIRIKDIFDRCKYGAIYTVLITKFLINSYMYIYSQADLTLIHVQTLIHVHSARIVKL